MPTEAPQQPDWLPGQTRPFTGTGMEPAPSAGVADEEPELSTRAGHGMAKLLSLGVFLLAAWIYISLFIAVPPMARLLQVMIWFLLLWDRKWPVFISFALLPVAASLHGTGPLLWFVEMTLWLIIGIWAWRRFRRGAGPLIYTPINALIIFALLLVTIGLMPHFSALWSAYTQAGTDTPGFWETQHLFEVFLSGEAEPLYPIRVFLQILLVTLFFFYLLSQFRGHKRQVRLLLSLFPFWIILMFLFWQQTRPSFHLNLSFPSSVYWLMFFAPLLLAIALSRVRFRKSRHQLGVIVLWLILSGIFMSLSPLAFLLTFGTAYLIAVLVFCKERWKSEEEISDLKMFLVLLSFLFFGALFLWLSMLFSPEIRFYSPKALFHGYSDSMMDEDALAAEYAAVALFSDHKLLGIGAGRFWLEAHEVYAESPLDKIPENEMPPLHLWRRIAAEYGILGLSFFSLFSLILLLKFTKAFWKSDPSSGSSETWSLAGFGLSIALIFLLWSNASLATFAVPVILLALLSFSLIGSGLVATDRMVLIDSENERISNEKRKAYRDILRLRFDTNEDDTFGARALWSLAKTCLFLPFLLLTTTMIIYAIHYEDNVEEGLDLFRLHIMVGFGVWILFAGAIWDRLALPGLRTDGQTFLLLLRLMYFALGILAMDLLKRLVFAKFIESSLLTLGNDFGALRVLLAGIALVLALNLALLISGSAVDQSKGVGKASRKARLLPWILLVTLPVCFLPDWLPTWLHVILALNPVYPAVRFFQVLFVLENLPGLGLWFGLIFWNLVFALRKMLGSPEALQVINASRAIHNMMKAQERGR